MRAVYRVKICGECKCCQKTRIVYKNQKSALLFLFLVMSTVMPSSISAPVEAPTEQDNQEIRDGYNSASKVPARKLEHVRQAFTFKNHGFEILPPTNCTVSEERPPFGKMYLFTGPKRSDSTSAVYTISIDVRGANEALPPRRVVVDAMLRPYKQHCDSYSDKAEHPIINGNVYEGAYFSGVQAGVAMKGHVLVAIKNNTIFIFFVQDRTKYYDQTESEFQKVLEKCTLS